MTEITQLNKESARSNDEVRSRDREVPHTKASVYMHVHAHDHTLAALLPIFVIIF